MGQKTRGDFEKLVCDGLGYCCRWAFFKYGSKRTGMIAARLGISDRAVRYQKSAFRSGDLKCECKSNCLKEKFSERVCR